MRAQHRFVSRIAYEPSPADVRTLCVIQARAGSTRLPGKVLADIAGRPMLRFMLDRLDTLAVDEVVVATSDSPADDAVADVARSAGRAVVRGPEHDVLARFGVAMAASPADVVVRLTADCPLADPRLVEAILATHLGAEADYTSNTLLRTYPDGLDVEVVTADALRRAERDAADSDEREHVTPHLYRNPDEFKLAAHLGERSLGSERWTVDTADDLEIVRRIVRDLGRVEFGWEEVLDVAPRAPRAGLWLDPPIGTHAADPGRREWVLTDADGRHGTARVEVHAGEGALDVRTPLLASKPDAVLTAIQDTLLQDLQVRVLRASHDLATSVADAVWNRAGFTLEPAGPVWRRSR